MSFAVELICFRCRVVDRLEAAGLETADDALRRVERLASLRGWEVDRPRKPDEIRIDLCPDCLESGRRNAERARRRRTGAASAGFTLVELLVVVLVVGIVAASALPTVLDAIESRSVESGAALVQAAIAAGRQAAARDGFAGLRFEVDPAFGVVRRADGTIDPAGPLAYDRITPLVLPRPYTEGAVEVHDSYPPPFAPLAGRLVLEESPMDFEVGPFARRAPTSWAWNVRCGEVVQYLGRDYVVCGPTVVPIGPENPEAFVNYGPPGASTGLRRYVDKQGAPVESEYLYLVDGRDDDGNGYVDDGWDGLDNDLNGRIDDQAEWELEAWAAWTPAPSPYSIRRRPVAEPGSPRSVRLPASVVVDATGWSSAALGSRARSQVPVDLYTGAADVVFDALGRVVVPGLYARPIDPPGNRPHLDFWVADRRDVTAPATPTSASRAAAIVTVRTTTGATATTPADVAAPDWSLSFAEGGR